MNIVIWNIGPDCEDALNAILSVAGSNPAMIIEITQIIFCPSYGWQARRSVLPVPGAFVEALLLI